MPKLYEVCPVCEGTGRMPVPDPRERTDDRQCPACKPLRVVETGLTTGQVERMVARETAEAMKPIVGLQTRAVERHGL